MIEAIKTIDQQLFLFLNGLHTPFMDPIMWYVSTIIAWIPLFIIVLYVAYKKGQGRLVLTIIGGLVLCILLSDRISVELFKEVFQRFRPTHNFDIQHLVHTVNKPDGSEYRGGLFSFVSSHATNASSVAFFVYLHLRRFSKYWGFIFVWVAIVSYSRIYLGVHYPADIVCGGLLGLSIGGLVYLLTLKLSPYKNLRNDLNPKQL